MINDLNKLNALIVAYESGSSGEFFCSLLTQSFNAFSNHPHSWIVDNRASFVDLFGKELSCGRTSIDLDVVKLKSYHYIKTHNSELTHIGSAHPRPPASIDFLNQYATNLPMIKIVCYELESKRFRERAAAEKLRLGQPINPQVELPNEMEWADQLNNPSIKVEWNSLFLHNTNSEFHRIEEFIGQPGNWDIFDSKIKDYMYRNRGVLLRSKLD